MTRRPSLRTVLLIWALFIVRGSFYCVMMPLWEGWDEYAHFAALDHWVAQGTLPKPEDPMPREIEQSLRLAPLSDELRWMGPPHLVHEDWWALPDAERSSRMQQLRELRPGFEPSGTPAVFYEAQQPPLYYWLVSLPLRFLPYARLADRVLLVRLLSLLLASSAIPLTWLAAGPRAGLTAAALLAVAPGFAIDTFRVANDSLAIALFALALWMLTRRTRWWQLGIVLGLGILSKAYLLVLFGPAAQRRKALALALLIGGWWYARNLAMGNSFTGWNERASLNALWHALFATDWIRAVAVMAKSFTWFGGWSFLTLKSWMYLAVEGAGLAAAITALFEKRRALAVPAAACGFFAAAMLYGNLVYSAAHNGAILPGWYFWPAGAALAVLVANAPRWMYTSLLVMLAAMDLYGASAVMMPYYAGLVPSGHASAALFFQSLHRLQIHPALAFGWIAATFAICITVFIRQRGECSESPR